MFRFGTTFLHNNRALYSLRSSDELFGFSFTLLTASTFVSSVSSALKVKCSPAPPFITFLISVNLRSVVVFYYSVLFQLYSSSTHPEEHWFILVERLQTQRGQASENIRWFLKLNISEVKDLEKSTHKSGNGHCCVIMGKRQHSMVARGEHLGLHPSIFTQSIHLFFPDSPYRLTTWHQAASPNSICSGSQAEETLWDRWMDEWMKDMEKWEGKANSRVSVKGGLVLVISVRDTKRLGFKTEQWGKITHSMSE